MLGNGFISPKNLYILFACTLGYSSIAELKSAILTEKDKVVGGLIDSYVAGEYSTELSESTGLKVATVFDHQFAYGFAISNTLNNNDVERCMRRTLSTMESRITNIIQEKMKALKVGICFF